MGEIIPTEGREGEDGIIPAVMTFAGGEGGVHLAEVSASLSRLRCYDPPHAFTEGFLAAAAGAAPVFAAHAPPIISPPFSFPLRGRTA